MYNKAVMSMQPRPPIVTIMGHVDHGKTTLLDYIRSTRVAQKEFGGITQHIGAYQAEIVTGSSKRLITFIDTPGHAAFKQMRSRGGNAADLVILVVAASEGVKPQTVESIGLISQSNTPFLVALTKMDMAAANPDKVKSELAEHGCLVEGYGGKVPVVEVSAQTGQGIDELLETILLMADMLDIRSDPDAPLSALVIETEKDKQKGIVASAIVHTGTMSIKDSIFAGSAEAKVKALLDFRSRPMQKALPGDPVQILGWNSLPEVGSQITSIKTGLTNVLNQTSNPNDAIVTCIIKADTQGSLDAIIYSLPKQVAVLTAEVGEPNNNDVVMAKTANARIVTFNVEVPLAVRNAAEVEKVKIYNYTIIYELLDILDDLVKRTINPYYDRDIIGKAEVLADFKIEKHRIAGCKVIEGEIIDDIAVDVVRNNNVVGTSRISSLKQAKQSIAKATINQEFGCILQPYVDFRVKDLLVAFKPKKQ